LAIAETRAFSIVRDAECGENLRIRRASST
jgi:hypothetical protein